MLLGGIADPEAAVSQVDAIDLLIGQKLVVVESGQAIGAEEEVAEHEAQSTAGRGAPGFVEGALFKHRTNEHAKAVGAIEHGLILCLQIADGQGQKGEQKDPFHW